jgi:hypothetical protein
VSTKDFIRTSHGLSTSAPRLMPHRFALKGEKSSHRRWGGARPVKGKRRATPGVSPADQFRIRLRKPASHKKTLKDRHPMAAIQNPGSVLQGCSAGYFLLFTPSTPSIALHISLSKSNRATIPTGTRARTTGILLKPRSTTNLRKSSTVSSSCTV